MTDGLQQNSGYPLIGRKGSSLLKHVINFLGSNCNPVSNSNVDKTRAKRAELNVQVGQNMNVLCTFDSFPW